MAGGGWAFVRARLPRPAPEPEAAGQAVPLLAATRVDFDAELSRLLSGDLKAVDEDAELQPITSPEPALGEVEEQRQPAMPR
jgi:hypothetical protein